jgi:Tfp pilus assembly protein FimV
MSVTMPRIMLLAGLLSLSSLWSTSSWALGLGEIHLNSALNEPMNADIDIIAATPEELTALRATLAPREAFTRYGIDRPPFLSSFTFKVIKKDGRDVLNVRSGESVPEPFVTFLVDVNWARGHLMREYTVLLDPPVYTPGENAGSSAPVTAPSTPRTPPALRAPRRAQLRLRPRPRALLPQLPSPRRFRSRATARGRAVPRAPRARRRRRARPPWRPRRQALPPSRLPLPKPGPRPAGRGPRA